MARSRVASPVRGWIALPVLAGALYFAPIPATQLDRFYSQGLYLWIQSGLTWLSNLVSIAVLDVMIAAAVAGVAFRTVWLLLRAFGGHPLSAIGEGARRAIRAVGLVTLAFFLCWGLNYRRVPLESAVGGASEPITAAALETAVLDANALAARARPSDPDDPRQSYQAIASRLREPMDRALALLRRAPLARPGVPKSSLLLTPFFTWAGVNGMINPLALESIVHPDLVPAERAFVLAHEWSHLAGHADEAEANAIGWLACMKGDPVLTYSGSVYLIMEAGTAMRPADWRRVSARLDAGVKADLSAIARRLEQQKPQVQQAATRVYDSYLKANRIPDGAESYGRALTLILGSPFRENLAKRPPAS